MIGAETYLKTQQVADALGVSVSTVKRWVDAGEIQAIRTMGKHRLVALSSALKFAREEKIPVENLLSIQSSLTDLIPDDLLIDRLVEALKHGKTFEVRDLIRSVCESKLGAVGLADQVIRPTMERIGHGWISGSWEVYQEHQATLMIASAIMDRSSKLSTLQSESRPLAIGASPAGDPYILPTLLGELVLREVGWEVKNFSNNLPIRSLARATREFRPKIVFLSASYLEDRDSFIRDYAYFYEVASQAGSDFVRAWFTPVSANGWLTWRSSHAGFCLSPR
jgi:excisionase family DNA binding protein